MHLITSRCKIIPNSIYQELSNHLSSVHKESVKFSYQVIAFASRLLWNYIRFSIKKTVDEMFKYEYENGKRDTVENNFN